MTNKEQGLSRLRYIKVSPRKARLAADLIRGMKVEEALIQLKYFRTKPAGFIAKAVKSALSNLENEADYLKREDLIVEEIRVDCGPVAKRSKSKCRGGRVPILKRTSHVKVIVGLFNKENKKSKVK